MMNIKNIKNLGFTMIELLIAISIIGLLAGISISVINPQRQRNIAQEAINKQTMYKISEGVDSYYIVTNSAVYPTNLFNEDGSSLPLLQLTPSDTPPSLVYKTSLDKTEFCLCLPSLVKKDSFLWFNSSTDDLIESEYSCEKTCE